MSGKRPARLTVQRGEDGSLELEDPEAGEAGERQAEELKPGVAAAPAKPDPSQDVPRNQPNPYWGAG